MKMKLHLLMASSLIISQLCLAQSPLWVIGSNYVDYNSPPPIQANSLPTPTGTDVYEGQQARATHNAYHNPVTGQLLFFIIDGVIYDNEGYIIEDLIQNSGSGTGMWGYAETLIVPDPGNCKRFYIIAGSWIDQQTPNVDASAMFAVLDLSIPRVSFNQNRMGALVSEFISGQNTIAYNLITSIVPNGQHYNAIQHAPIHIACTPKLANNTYLLVVQMGTLINYNFVISASGINYVFDSALTIEQFMPASQVFSPNQTINGIGDLVFSRSELEIFQKPNGNFTVIGNQRRSMPIFNPDINDFTGHVIEVIYKYDIDGQTLWPIQGSYQEYQHWVSQTPVSPMSLIKGFELSPDKNYLYFTSTPNSALPKSVYCLDMNTFQLVNLPNIPNSNHLQYSRIERASNGSIYFAAADGLHVLSMPDAPALASISFQIPVTLNLADMYQNGTPNWQDNFGQYLLPDQLDFDPNCQIGCYSYTCGDGSADESCCNFYSAFVPNSFHDIVVSENTTWQPGGVVNGQTIPSGSNVTLKIEGNITILPGATLNINNLRLEFSPTSRIIVSRGATTSSAGAQLNVNNSTLTVWENCGDCYMWQGVQVVGYSQISSNLPQGKVQFSNNSVVEYAYVGVSNARLNGTFSGPQGSFFIGPTIPTTMGGRIEAIQTTFRNNLHDAYFLPYNHQHQSLFDRCLFITNDNLKTNIVTRPTHIVVLNNRDVFIRGGRFENETDFLANQQNRGTGILSVNSQVLINFFGTTQSTRFNKLETGINAMSSNSPFNLHVSSAVFNDNITGVFALGENRIAILESRFNVFRNPDGSATRGVVFDGCNAYRVEDNVFDGTNPFSTESYNNFGIVVSNSGPFANVIEKNQFLKLNNAATAVGENAVDYVFINPLRPPRGLQYLCNEFNDNMNSISVRQGTIAPHQGDCFSLVIPGVININRIRPAGNIFSNNNIEDYHIWVSENMSMLRYFYNDLAFYNEPLTNSSNVTPIACTPSPNIVVCGDTYRQNEGLTVNLLLDKRKERFNQRKSLELNLDFGNRDSVLALLTNPQIAPVKKRDMLNKGTNIISDEVFITYINSNPPVNMLYNVLEKNSPLSPRVLAVMHDNSRMPNGMKQQIMQLQYGTSQYEAYAQVLQDIQLELNAIESVIVETCSFDSTGLYCFTNVVEMYENTPIKDELYQERLFSAYVGANMSNEADSLARILKSNKNDANYNFLIDLAVQSTSMNYFEILSADSTIIENLEMLAEGDDYHIAPRARAILSGYLGYQFDFELPEESGIRSMHVSHNFDNGTIHNPITIFPNPASDNFFIVFDQHADVSQNREARIYDLTGNLQFTRSFDDNAYVLEINTDNMTKGMYIVVISSNGTDVGTYKVAVR
jgi:hypothetical protein